MVLSIAQHRLYFKGRIRFDCNVSFLSVCMQLVQAVLGNLIPIHHQRITKVLKRWIIMREHFECVTLNQKRNGVIGTNHSWHN